MNKQKFAIVAESSQPISLSKITTHIKASKNAISGMNLLSPCQLLLFFKSESDVDVALSEESDLWCIFDDLHRWSEGEIFSDRLVWLECFELHPKCWSLENARTIGEKWGPVVYVDQNHNGIQCLSHIRMLVRTKAQNRIDARIRVLFDNGCCDVWVKECGDCECKLSDAKCKKNSFHEGDDAKEYVSDSSYTHHSVENSVEIREKHGQTHLDTGAAAAVGFVTPSRKRVNADSGWEGEVQMLNSHAFVNYTNEKVEPRLGNGDGKNQVRKNTMALSNTQQDPLINDVLNKCTNWSIHECFDPMATVELVAFSSLPAAIGTFSHKPTCFGHIHSSGNTGKRLRGRPKRTPILGTASGHACDTATKSVLEAHNTWNVAAALGVSTSDEEAALVELRKSKRLLLLDGQNS